MDLSTEVKGRVFETSKILAGIPGSARIYQNLQKYTKLHFKICNSVNSIYYQRESKTGVLKLLQSKPRLFFVKFQVFLHFFYIFITTAYFLLSGRKLLKVHERIMAASFISAWGICAFMQTEFWIRREEALFLFRSIITFENRYMPAASKKLDKLTWSLMILGIVSCFGLPGMMTLIITVNPCMPPHLSFIFFKTGLDTCFVPSWTMKIVLLLLDGYLWVIALPHGLFYVFQTLLVGVRCQFFYVRQMHRGYIKHPNSDLWYRLYREIQILNKVFNTVFQPVFFPGVIAVGLFVAIMGTFALIRLREDIPFPQILFFPIIASDGLSIIAITKIAAMVFHQSLLFLGTGKGRIDGNQRKGLHRKRFMSLDKIKVRFSGNFVDDGTPLNFTDFLIGQTVSLLLLRKKQH